MRLLWLLFDMDELSVMELAQGIGVSPSYASFHMKVLFMAGMVRFRRENMRVIYRPEADARNIYAVELLDALKNCHNRKVSFQSVVRQITAYTHGRRIEIVRLLMDGPVLFNELLERSGMSSSALSRGLLKLEARNVVREDGERYHLVVPPEPLGKTLVRIVCSKEEK